MKIIFWTILILCMTTPLCVYAVDGSDFDADKDGDVDGEDLAGFAEYFGKSCWYKDYDEDFYSDGTKIWAVSRPEGHYLESELTAINGDCDDNNGDVNPEAEETCNDSTDNDCDGATDCDDADCADDPICSVEAGAQIYEDLSSWQSGDDPTIAGNWYCNASLPVSNNGVLTDWEIFVNNGGDSGDVAQIAVIRCSSGGGGTGPALSDCIRVGLGPLQSIDGNALNSFSLAGSTQLDGASPEASGIVVQAGDYICADSAQYSIGVDCNGSPSVGGCPGPDFDTQFLGNLNVAGEPFALNDSNSDGTLMIKAWGNPGSF